jgi:hypothetical protein
MRAVSLEPSFGKRGTRAFVCGGMAGKLIMHEKSWLGHKETTIYSGEGPIWSTSWRVSIIVSANDAGVKFYDTASSQRVGVIDRPENAPRADLFKCNFQWRDDTTIIIAWADFIQLVRIRPRTAVSASLPYQVEITAVFQVEYMIAGVTPHATPPGSFLVLAYIPPEKFENEATLDRAEQRRKAANRPELRIISRAGEELSYDVLNFLNGFESFGCNDYLLQPAFVGGPESSLEGFYVVCSPRDIVLVRPRDHVDHVEWLVEHRKFAEALTEIKRLSKLGVVRGLDAGVVGRKYIRHLFDEGATLGMSMVSLSLTLWQLGDFEKAAQLCPSVFDQDQNAWEEEVFIYLKHNRLQVLKLRHFSKSRLIPFSDHHSSRSDIASSTQQNRLRSDPCSLSGK